MAKTVLGIPTYKEYMRLTQSGRTTMLLDLLNRFSDNEVREAWGLKYNAFYNHKKKAMASAQPTGEGTGSQQQQAPEPPGPSLTADGRTIIDAEFEVIEEGTNRNLPAVVEEKESGEKTLKVELPILNFNDKEGTVEELEQQLAAIQTVLSVMGGKDTRYRLNIQVYKA